MTFSERPGEPRTLELPTVSSDASQSVGPAPGANPPEPPDSPPALPANRQPRTPGRDWRAALGVIAVLAFCGLPLGAVWRWLTPEVEMVHVPAGWGIAEETPEQYVAADGIFGLLGLGVGCVAAIVVWLTMRQRRGPILLTGLVLGGIASQVVAWRFGRMGREAYVASLEDLPVGWHAWRVPDLLMVDFRPVMAWQRVVEGDVSGAFGHLALGVLASAGFAAAFTYTVCAGWSKFTSLRGDDVRPEAGGETAAHRDGDATGAAPTMQNAPTATQHGRLPSLTC